MSSAWKLSGEQITTQGAGYEAIANPIDPAEALQVVETGSGQCWNACSLAPLPAHGLKVNEVYPRENDLISSFAQTDDDLFSFEIQWRRIRSDTLNSGTEMVPCLALDLWISVQTLLLDVEPEVEVRIERKDCEEFRLADLLPATDSQVQDSVAAISHSFGQGSAVWMMQPSDLSNVAWQADRNGQAVFHLFGHFMEKGVIRRARMRYLVFEETASEQAIKLAYHQFAGSPLPLTA